MLYKDQYVIAPPSPWPLAENNDPIDRGDVVEPDTTDDGTEGQPAATDDGTEGQPAATDDGTEGQPAATDDDGSGGDGAPGSGWIPRYRYNTMARRNRELERELEELRSQNQTGQQQTGQQQTSDTDVDPATKAQNDLAEVNKQIADAIKNDEHDKVPELLTKQQQVMTEANRQLVQQSTQQVQSQTKADLEYEKRLNEVESQFPILNPDSNQFDQELGSRAARLVSAFESQGMSPADALDEAMNTLDPVLQARVQQTEASAGQAATQAGQQRAAQQRQTNAQAAAAQPPATSDVGARSDSQGKTSDLPDVSKLSEEEFKQLPEATKSRLRGDTV